MRNVRGFAIDGDAIDDHGYAKDSVSLDQVRKNYQRVQQLLPTTDDDYKKADEILIREAGVSATLLS